jgi:photosystem II stability/assembly factor-like uncharacterized protein
VGGGEASLYLSQIAFFGPETGYGVFDRVGAGGATCLSLVGETTDGGSRFGHLSPVTSWQCSDMQPAGSLAFDDHGDGFYYGPELFVTHDGGRRWAADPQRATVLSVAALGYSVWMLEARCQPSGHVPSTCPLHLLESVDGGRSWAPAPEQPQSPAAAGNGTGVAMSAADRGSLVRVDRSSAYVLMSPVADPYGEPDSAPLRYTGDSGASWSERHVPCGVDALSAALSVAPDGALMAVCAGQPSVGAQLKSAARSTDGGRTWQVHSSCVKGPGCQVGSLDAGYLGAIDAVSARTAFLVGGRSPLTVTTDGGESWRAVNPLIGGSDAGTAQVIFFNSRDGVVLGTGSATGEPALWRTSDGGAEWSKVVPRTV